MSFNLVIVVVLAWVLGVYCGWRWHRIYWKYAMLQAIKRFRDENDEDSLT